MSPNELPAEQVEKFRSVMNRAITVLAPDLKPGEPINFSNDQLRLIAGALGSEGAAREVEAYVQTELEKWDSEPLRKAFLDELLAVVIREIELLEFYREEDRQREYPLPSHVKIVDADTGRSDKEMPIEDFLAKLRAISASSVFKR